MRKRILVGILIIVSIFMITGCNSKNKDNEINNNENSKIETNKKENNPNEVISSVRATINGKQYTIQLEDNETAKGFANLLPQEFNMIELNGNEKYIYLDITLPTNSSNPKHIDSGDVPIQGMFKIYAKKMI